MAANRIPTPVETISCRQCDAVQCRCAGVRTSDRPRLPKAANFPRTPRSIDPRGSSPDASARRSTPAAPRGRPRPTSKPRPVAGRSGRHEQDVRAVPQDRLPHRGAEVPRQGDRSLLIRRPWAHVLPPGAPPLPAPASRLFAFGPNLAFFYADFFNFEFGF